MSGADETSPSVEVSEGFHPPATADPMVLARALGLSLDRLAKLARVRRTTLIQNPNGTRAQAALVPLSHLMAKLSWMGNGEVDIVRWFHTATLHGMGPETPLQCVEQGRIASLEFYLETILNGVYA